MRSRFINVVLAAISCALLFFLTSCGSSPRLPAIPPEGVIVAFGDSLTAGTGANDYESYPAVLSKMIGRTVINAGVPGEVSAGGVQRLPEILDRHKPVLLILCHGGNDLLGRQDQRLIADNLHSMIRTARESGIAVLLLAVPTPDLTLAPPAFYKEIATELNLPIELKILPKVLGKSSLKSDHIHPNAAGYRMVAESVAGLLKKSGALP
jgi:lysophospholipase L1-like esterase